MDSPMDSDDVKVIEKTTPFDGYFRIDRYRLSHRLFEGGWSGPFVREVFERGHAACALLFDPHRDALVFVEQFRIGAYAAIESRWFDDAFSPWLLEPIAGIIEDGEDPADVVRREAVEEAGCTITDLLPVCHYLATPGGSSESMFVFCGRVDSENAGGIHGLSEEYENIRVVVAPVADAIEWLDEGRIVNAMTLIALQWFKANHQKIKRQWLDDKI